jgi:hypothetical protein
MASESHQAVQGAIEVVKCLAIRDETIGATSCKGWSAWALVVVLLCAVYAFGTRTPSRTRLDLPCVIR